MRIGYWRSWASGPNDQVQALEAAGCQDIYGEVSPKASEPLIERNHVIQSLRPGDVLVVAAPEVLGREPSEILEALAEIHRVTLGCAGILDLSSDEIVQWDPGGQRPLDFVARGSVALSRALGASTPPDAN
jgi:hypothetical protein